MARTKSKESDVQSAICDYLTLKGYFFSRTNNAPTYDKTHGIFRSLPKYPRRGWPDICLIKNGTFYGIEVKSGVGRLSPEQHQLGRDTILNGGHHVVARSIDNAQ